MLKYFWDNDLIRFHDGNIKEWEEAIRISCENLLEKEMITEVYVQEIIDCVHKYGPYIVIVPGVAMPHSSGESEGVLGTGIAFTKMSNPVSFDDNDDEKSAKLFFTLAAKNPEEHTENIGKLAELLMQDGLIEALNDVTSKEEYAEVMQTFSE